MNKTGAAHYLAAMLDGEGNICHSGTSRWISIANTDPDIIAATVRACEVLGIRCRVIERSPGQAHHRVLWRVQISHRDDMERFYEVVPIQATCKREKLAAVLASYRPRRPTPEVLHRMYVEERKGSYEIAALLGRDASAIRDWLKADGVALRTMSEAALARRAFWLVEADENGSDDEP